MNDRHSMTFFVSARRVTMSEHATICCQLHVIGAPTRSARRVTMSEHAHNLLSIECHRVTDQIWGGTKVVASVTQIESPTTLCENCAFWREKLVFASVTQIESPTRLLFRE